MELATSPWDQENKEKPMLVVSRKTGQEIVIGDSIRVTVLSVRGTHVRLGFDAPVEVRIQRDELQRRNLGPTTLLPASDSGPRTPSYSER